MHFQIRHENRAMENRNAPGVWPDNKANFCLVFRIQKAFVNTTLAQQTHVVMGEHSKGRSRLRSVRTTSGADNDAQRVSGDMFRLCAMRESSYHRDALRDALR